MMEAVALMLPTAFSTTHWYCPASVALTSLTLKKQKKQLNFEGIIEFLGQYLKTPPWCS